MLTPYPEQLAHIERLAAAVERRGGALDSSHTGTGKTLCALETAKKLGNKVFVICPKVVIPAWKAAIIEQGVECIGVFNYEKLRTGNTSFVAKSGKTFLWNMPQGTILIFDEVHKCKASKLTLNAKLLTTAKAQGFRTLMLSATACKSPVDMRAVGYALGLHQNTNFYRWAKEYGATFNVFGALEFGKKDREVYLQRLNRLLYPTVASKLTREDLGQHFEETSVIIEPMDFGDDGKIEKLVTEMEEELGILQERVEKDRQGASALTEILRMRQRVELLKVPTIVTLAEEALEEGNSVVVFLNFVASLEAFEERAKTPSRSIRGSQTPEVRQANIDTFQENKCRLLTVMASAGGVGVSLHALDADYPRVSFVSPDYSEITHQQCLGRIDRVGGKAPSVQRVLVANGIEQRVMKALHNKLTNMETLHSV